MVNYTNFLKPILSLRYSPNGNTDLSSKDVMLKYNNVFDINRIGETSQVEGGESLSLGLEFKSENKIGVITRGKIKLSKQMDFWLNVSSASDAIKNADGVEFYKGIGELPLLSQATFSVWKNHKSISDFAYKNQAHSEIIKKTRERKWYSEDLFARFEIKEIKTQDF